MSIFSQQRAIERLTDRLESVDNIVSELVRDRKKLDLEFTDLYDKVRRQMSRMAKRAAVDDKGNGFDAPEELVPDHLQHLDPISRSIMLRRGGPGIKK